MTVDAIIDSTELRKGVLMIPERLEGSGWLRTRGWGSSTAVYEIELRRQEGGPGIAADGTLRAEVAIMIEARSARRAVLVLASGEAIAIEIVDMTPAGLVFHVVDDVAALAGKRG